MTTQVSNQIDEAAFDPLDMSHYRIDKLPKRNKGKFERQLARIGAPLAVIVFFLFAFVIDMPFLQNIDPSHLSKSAKAAFDSIGEVAFIRSNVFLAGIFLAGLILWMTEAIPNYLTSLILIAALVLFNVVPENKAYANLGHPVMWLNIMSFILASMLVATGIAKRFALWFIIKFGKNASSIFISFLVINVVLSAFISATTAKAAILLPIFMVIAAIFGATGGDSRNNFGRSIVLQNLFYINTGATGFLTGAGAHLYAVALIVGVTGGNIFYSEWLSAQFPVMIVTVILGYIVATKIFFPLKPNERIPQIEGGMERLKQEYKKLGKMSFSEKKAIFIFVSILLLWSTDKLHGISPTAVAFVGGIVALLPRIGVVKWNEVDIPWHLMLFSAGAYTLGTAFSYTDLPSLTVNAFFNFLGIGNETPFWKLYLLLTGVMTLSAVFFQSKTMRAMVFVPIAIGVATRFNFSILSLSLPVAFMINHVYVLPFNSKPAALLYETNHYSIGDSFKYGMTMMIISWIINIVAGETLYRVLEITPNGVFGLF
ncbi:MAG TPA: SLC13 family permease [Salinivirgaceae bacterium]|nr:SLC13 family permease [Salinivirgaceae bacterium]